MGDNKRWSAADFAALLWAALHIYTSIHAFMYGLYQTYTSRTWILLGIWLLGQLALDAWLYAGRPRLLRFVKWYWGVSVGMYGALMLVVWLDSSLPTWPAVLFVLCTLLTPMHQLTALFWVLFQNLEGRTLNHAELSAGLLFCLVHFVYIARLHRRAKKRGETAHGPVDPGAGAVE